MRLLSQCLTKNEHFGRFRVFAFLCCLLLISSFASAKSHRALHKPSGATHAKAHSRGTSAARAHSRGAAARRSKIVKVAKSHGQRGIESERAREIQEALIREKYLDGTPSGEWDQATRSAMARFQADHGWQTKNVPDARALIKLGLGPNHADILNPDTADIANPALVDNSRVTMPGGASVSR